MTNMDRKTVRLVLGPATLQPVVNKVYIKTVAIVFIEDSRT